MTKEQMLESYPDGEFLFLRGFDDAIVGVAISHGNYVPCYSMKKMVDALVQDHDMTSDEALEFLEFNTFYAHFGTATPVYLEDING